MIKYFYLDNCPNCAQVQFPDNLHVERYNIAEQPFQAIAAPCLVVGSEMTVAGVGDVNNLLKILSNAERGEYNPKCC